MPCYLEFLSFAEALQTGGRLVGLDIGMKKIGIAFSDATRIIATPHSTLMRQSYAKDTAAITKLMDEYQASGVVIGLPVTLQGHEQDSAKLVRDFSRKLLLLRDSPIYFQDERFSTAAVMRALNESTLTRQKKSLLDDKMAASYLLQGVLDQLRSSALR